MGLLSQALGFPPKVGQMHWGGGTPTYFTPAELIELDGVIREHFLLDSDAEIAIEVDPRVTTREHLETLRKAGFNRVSLGVQDVTPEVQEATGRHQDVESTRQLYHWSRDLGFDSVNIDLVYGLPAQTLDRFDATLAEIVDLRPDRLAIYGYAHLPAQRPNQRKIDASLLPSREVKFELFARALAAFGGAGYRLIGMDHFALPDDEMSLALEAGTLHRNFMGYSVRHTRQMIGLGISSIGEVGDAFVQNEKKLSTYYKALDAGRLPVHKGFALDDDDKIRRQVILQLMCNLRLRLADIQQEFGIDPADYFADELQELRGEPSDDGFVEVGDGEIVVTPLGQRFLRNICMIFDRYLKKGRGPATAFSRTI
jgi:oxygen-independent coproporphyrinogen-3 oxidase